MATWLVATLALLGAGSVAAAPPSLPPILTGADAGGSPQVKGFLPDGTTQLSFFAYDPSFTGGVRVAAGDVNGDGFADSVTGAGPGGSPHVKVFSGQDGSLLRSFFAYDPAFSGGVYVAVGDVNGDDVGDIITGAGAGGGPYVKAFSGKDGSELRSFFAYDPAFTGGVRVAAGDVNGDGVPDIVTGAGSGGSAHVKAFSGLDGSELRSFFAYGPAFGGGVYVAAGDLDGDGFGDIITGADAGGGPHVKAFSGKNGSELRSFFAYDPAFTGGVRVAVGDVNGDGFADIIAGAGPGGAPEVKAFDGLTLALLSDFFAYDPLFTGGVYVASPAIPARLSGTVYYDANTNGQRDNGEPGLPSWPIKRNGADVASTNAQGTFTYALSPAAQENVIRQVGALVPWQQTGNLVDQSKVAGGASVTLNQDKSYTVDTVAGSTASDLDFGDVCLGAGGGHDIPFWTSRDGAERFDKGYLAPLAALNLRNADGSDFDPRNYALLRVWLKKANTLNMAYMLSAELAAMKLNVLSGDVAGTGLVFAPASEGGADANGFITVNGLMAEANAELGRHELTPAGSPWRAYQEGLTNALEAANGNTSFVQAGPDSCPPPAFLR